MKIITVISFACEPVITYRAHDPSPSGRTSEPGRGLDRGPREDQQKASSWKAVAKSLQNTLGRWETHPYSSR